MAVASIRTNPKSSDLIGHELDYSLTLSGTVGDSSASGFIWLYTFCGSCLFFTSLGLVSIQQSIRHRKRQVTNNRIKQLLQYAVNKAIYSLEVAFIRQLFFSRIFPLSIFRLCLTLDN